MSNSKSLNISGAFIGLVSGFASSLVLAVLAGVFIALVGSVFMNENGETSILFDIIFFPLFVLPPYVICGYVAGCVSKNRKLFHSIIAGCLYLVFMILMAFIPDEEPFVWTDILHYLPIIPLALFGGWLAPEHVG